MNSLRVWTQRLMLARALLLSVVTFILLILKFFEIELFTPEIDATIFKLGLFLYLLNIIYIYPVNRLKNHFIAFIYFQLLIDVILSASLINSTHRLESPFIFLFSLYVVSGALMLGRDGAWFCAILSIASICVLTVFDLLSLSFDRLQNTAFFIKEIVVRGLLHSVSLSVLAILMSFLSDQLKSTSSILAKSEQDLANKEKDLQALQGIYAKLIEEMNMGLLLSDQYFQILMMNPYAQQKLGLRFDVNQPKLSLINDLKIPYTSDQILAHDSTIDWQYEKDQEKLRLEGHLSKINALSESEINQEALQASDQDNRQAWLFLFQDVTQKKALEEKMLKHQHLASIGQLASQIAHEIRNPLTAMSNGIELIKTGQLSQEKHQRIFEIIDSEIKRLNGLIDDFLKFARPKDLNLEWVSLKDCLQPLIDLWSIQSNLKIEYHDPNQSAQKRIQIDPKALKQVFSNLIKNSIEAHATHIQIEIEFGVPKANALKAETLEILIRDNGIGIDDFEDLQKQIFEPFFTNKEKGSGLGLAISMKILELHHGDLSLISGHGLLGGCEFMIEIPMIQRLG